MELPVKSPASRARKGSYRIETRSLSYKLGSRYDEVKRVCCGWGSEEVPELILKGVSCEARPGEITAIAGPSGAGKTTLLEVLAGRTCGRVCGQVLVNDQAMDAGLFRRKSGYVTQDDALFPLLTVEETLMYSALLRLQGGRREAGSRVKELMRELGLEHVAGSRIAELVHDPAVIFIDEPTSGLDSASALHLILLLKATMVGQGKTVVLTIHQPGFRILELVDRLVLLSNGLVLHNGSLNLLEERLKFAEKKDACASLYREEKPPFYSNSRFEEVLILGQRFCSIIFRTKQLFAARIIQALVAGLVLGTVFINTNNDQGKMALQARIGFFAFTLTFLLSSTTEGLPIFLQERRILMRETSRGAYRVSSYVLSNTLIFLPFLLMVSLLYATPVYWLVGLRRDMDGFLYFSLVVWLVVLMSNSFVACFSALVPNFIMGTSVISGLMGSFFLFSGYFIAEKNIPSYWIFMHYLSLFKYPFECFMINEYGGEEGKKRCLEEPQKWSNLAVMLGFILGYRLLCFFILLCRCCRTFCLHLYLL
ncbi:unnamed protein product, partial [Vitis vinifera]